jgi:hypothetical protein
MPLELLCRAACCQRQQRGAGPPRPAAGGGTPPRPPPPRIPRPAGGWFCARGGWPCGGAFRTGGAAGGALLGARGVTRVTWAGRACWVATAAVVEGPNSDGTGAAAR